jgi:hypothetical protein
VCIIFHLHLFATPSIVAIVSGSQMYQDGYSAHAIF